MGVAIWVVYKNPITDSFPVRCVNFICCHIRLLGEFRKKRLPLGGATAYAMMVLCAA